MAHDVFISYSSKDKEAAEAVCAKLESNGIKCWIAPRDIPPGARYAQSIINGINTSRLMIFIFSSHAGDSEHIESEIDRAYNKRIPIIPLRIEDLPLSGSLEYYLSTAQWFNALTPPFDEHLERLPEVVRQLLETDTNAAPVTAAPRPTPAGLPPQSNRQKLLNAITPLNVTIGLFLIAAIITAVYFFQLQKKKTADNVEGNNAVTTSDSIVVDSRINRQIGITIRRISRNFDL